jgi:hypothetical protein
MAIFQVFPRRYLNKMIVAEASVVKLNLEVKIVDAQLTIDIKDVAKTHKKELFTRQIKIVRIIIFKVANLSSFIL